MKRWLSIVAAVALIAVALPLIAADSPAAQGAGPNATPAPGARGNGNGNGNPPPTANDENFRKDLQAYFAGLQDVVTAISNNPHTQKHVHDGAKDPAAAVKVGQQVVAQLNGPQLQALAKVLAQNPNWKQQPEVIAGLVNNVKNPPTPGRGRPRHAALISGEPGSSASASALPHYQAPTSLLALVSATQNTQYHDDAVAADLALAPQNDSGTVASADTTTLTTGYYDEDCSQVAHDTTTLRGLFYSYWAAVQAASIAAAANAAAPSSVDFAPAVIATGVAFGVLNLAAINLQTAFTLAYDCVTFDFNVQLVSTYPTNGGRASSQISVDALKLLSGGIDTAITQINDTVNQVTATLSTVINSLGTAQGTANGIQTIVTDIQSRADDLLTNVGQGNDNTDSTANGLANDINAHEDTLLTNLSAFQALSVQMEIERNLAVSSQPPLAIFALPQTQGGYLETARAVVASTIANLQASGQSVGNAQQFLSRGDADAAAGQYATAYGDYAKAYQMAVQ